MLKLSEKTLVSRLLVCLLLSSVALMGCGDSSSSAHRHPLSKAAFLSRANAICLAAAPRIETLQKPTDMPSMATFMAEALPISEEIRAKLEALVPPTSDQSKYARLLGLYAQTISKLPEIRSAAEASDEKRAQRLINDLASLDQREHGLEEELGLKECGSNGES